MSPKFRQSGPNDANSPPQQTWVQSPATAARAPGQGRSASGRHQPQRNAPPNPPYTNRSSSTGPPQPASPRANRRNSPRHCPQTAYPTTPPPAYSTSGNQPTVITAPPSSNKHKKKHQVPQHGQPNPRYTELAARSHPGQSTLNQYNLWSDPRPSHQPLGIPALPPPLTPDARETHYVEYHRNHPIEGLTMTIRVNELDTAARQQRVLTALLEYWPTILRQSFNAKLTVTHEAMTRVFFHQGARLSWCRLPQCLQCFTDWNSLENHMLTTHTTWLDWQTTQLLRRFIPLFSLEEEQRRVDIVRQESNARAGIYRGNIPGLIRAHLIYNATPRSAFWFSDPHPSAFSPDHSLRTGTPSADFPSSRAHHSPLPESATSLSQSTGGRALPASMQQHEEAEHIRPAVPVAEPGKISPHASHSSRVPPAATCAAPYTALDKTHCPPPPSTEIVLGGTPLHSQATGSAPPMMNSATQQDHQQRTPLPLQVFGLPTSVAAQGQPHQLRAPVGVTYPSAAPTTAPQPQMQAPPPHGSLPTRFDPSWNSMQQHAQPDQHQLTPTPQPGSQAIDEALMAQAPQHTAYAQQMLGHEQQWLPDTTLAPPPPMAPQQPPQQHNSQVSPSELPSQGVSEQPEQQASQPARYESIPTPPEVTVPLSLESSVASASAAPPTVENLRPTHSDPFQVAMQTPSRGRSGVRDRRQDIENGV